MIKKMFFFVVILTVFFQLNIFAKENTASGAKKPVDAGTELSKEKEKLQSLSIKKSILENEVKKVTSLLSKKQMELNKHKEEYEKLIRMQNELNNKLKEQEYNINELKEYISKRVRFIYKRGKYYPLKVIYNSKGYLGFVKNVTAIKIMSDREFDDFNRVSGEVASIKRLREELEISLVKSKEIYSKEKAAERELVRQRIEKNKLLTMIKSEEYLLEKKIESLKENVSTTVDFGNEDDVKRIESEANTVIRDEENSSFARQKKRFRWPVKGDQLTKRLKESNDRGIMIAVSEEDIVQSIYEGKIAFSGPFEKYGNLIIVEHEDGYYSVYGYNGFIFVKEGQKVFAGKILGKIRLDTDSTGKLYFEINHRGTPLNPVEWLQ